MGTERFTGILSILIIVSLIAPAVTTVSFLSISQVSASPGPDNYENIVRGKALAYTLNGDATPPWRVYEVGDNPVIMAANTVDNGAVVAAGLAATARNERWNSISNPYPNFDILLDNAFRWMTGLEPNQVDVLWYGEAEIDYNVYNDASACSELISALGSLGYTVTDTVNTVFDNITPALLSGIDILVIPQMELGDTGTGGDPTQLPDGVVDVIENFVRTGGGLLIMEGYDTFGYNYCWVQNKILKALDMGIYFQSDTVQDDTNNWGGAPWQPLVNVDNTTWIGSAYENATGVTTIGVYGASSLAGRYDNIFVRISPGYRAAFPNTTIKYTVSVFPHGYQRDNINLSVVSTWTATLDDNRFENVGLEGKETTLTVTIPPGTALGAEDEITVIATSDGHPTARGEAKCKAIASMQIGPPVEDTYVTQWSQEAGQTLGTYIWMQVGSGPENNKRTYLKFDLSAIPEGLIPPDDVQIDDIHARLFLYNEVLPTYAAAGKEVSIYEVNDDTWHENEMWWGENEPAIGDYLDMTKVTEEDYWYSWDVTAHVIDEFRNDNIASFSLRAETENLKYPDSFPYYSFATSNATESWKHPYLIIGYDVSTWISPDYDGLPGGTLTYTVNVWNKGSENDNFDLYIENVWETTLTPTRIEHLEPMDIGTATLTVKIPEGATIGDNDTILVTAVSEGYPGENDNSTCIARASSHVSAWEDSSTKGRDDPPHHLENSLWGRATGIYVGRFSDGPERGWLKFDLRAFPAGTTITRANLSLNCYSTDGANVKVYSVDNDNWSEYTINWLNKPPIDNVLDRRVVIESDKLYTWDVTDFVANEFVGDKIASFCLVDIGENIAPNHSARFDSKESEEDMPYLEILATAPDLDVRAYAEPIFQGGLVGDTLTYTITVMNTGENGDTYTLAVAETEPWGSNLSNALLVVPAGENRTTTLSVPIPSGNICTINDITITVTSQANPAIYDKIRCSAHRSKVWFVNRWGSSGKLRTKYEVWLDLNVLLRDDASELVLKFYTWGGSYQGKNVLSTTMPAHLETLWKNPHPQSTPQARVEVEKAELVLTDAEGTTIQTITTFIVTKWMLEVRFMEIPLEWALAGTPEEREDLEEEFMNIPFMWALAPS